jgi:hypothetical protein
MREKAVADWNPIKTPWRLMDFSGFAKLLILLVELTRIELVTS